MELFPGFFYFNVKKENFVDSSSIMAIKDSDGVSCIEVGGGGKENINKTIGHLDSAGITIRDIHTAIISHSHADHMGAIAHFKSINPDIRIVNHKLDSPYMENNHLLNEIFESHEIQRYFPEKLFDVIEFYKLFCPISEAKTDIKVNDGNVILCGDYSFHVIHTPGHHPGHISLYEKDLKVLFAGDMVGMDVPFYNNISGGVSGFIESLKTFNRLSIDLIIPSHGNLIYNPYEIINKIISKLQRREERILNALLDGPKCFSDLLPVLFRDENFYAFPGVGILSSHLDKLKKDNMVIEDRDNYILIS